MLPDLRIVIVAVLSTFVLTVGVGFYTSSRLINEPKKRADSLAALEESPVNRIALSWPEPIRQSEPLALDFAITARALRNPVRDVTSAPTAVEPLPQPEEPLVRTTAVEPATPAANGASAKDEPAPASSKAIPSAVAVEPDIRMPAQYPPIFDLPLELRTPSAVATEPAPLATTARVIATPATTGSIAATPANDEPRAALPQQDRKPEAKVANLPDPADVTPASDPALQSSEDAKPAPKAARKKAAPKKAAAKKAAAKAAKRPARKVAPRSAARSIDNNFPINFFGLSTN